MHEAVPSKGRYSPNQSRCPCEQAGGMVSSEETWLPGLEGRGAGMASPFRKFFVASPDDPSATQAFFGAACQRMSCYGYSSALASTVVVVE